MQKKSNNNYTTIKNCRLCGSKNLKDVYKFKDVPIGNDLSNKLSSSIKSRKYPLKLISCKVCNHYQLSIVLNPKILFAKNYSYLTGVTNTFNKHFDNYSSWIIKKCKLKKGSIVMDIGSNDGTCLKYFKNKDMSILGIDPASVPSKIANERGIETLNLFFNKKSAYQIKKKYGEADFITSHNVLAHIDNIKEVINSIYFLLKEGGFFCFEVGYFKTVLEKNYFDTVYHEHLDYHHAYPLTKFLEFLGFSIKHLSKNNIQGGSLRILARKERHLKNRNKSINNFLIKEKRFFYAKEFKKQFNNFEKSMKILNKMINKILIKNNSIYAYGSPTKASLLLSSAKLNIGKIKNTFEDNIHKCNKFIPGTDIKIVNSNKIVEFKPNYILILAWNFAEEIKIKLKQKRYKKISLIIPLPEPKIINI